MTFRRNCHTPALKCANRLRSVMKLLDAFRYLERERRGNVEAATT